MKKERLPAGELDIMKALWESEAPLRAGEIAKALATEHSWKTPTVHKLLSRLEEKGFVYADRTCYYHKFSPAISEVEYISGQSKEILEKSGQRLPQMVASLMENCDVTDEELDELYEIIKDRLKQIKKKEV